MKITKQIAIRAEPEQVWDVITDLRHAGRWAPGFDDYPFISDDWPEQGAEATWRYHFGFLSADFKLKITRSVRGRHLQIENSGAFGMGWEDYRFGSDDEMTTVYYQTSSKPNLLGRIMLPLMIRNLLWRIDTTIANLKEYCEQRAGSS